VLVYPNPGRGITNVTLPVMADVIVEDGSGRTVQQVSKAKAGILQLKNLKPGFYIIKIRTAETHNLIIKKLTVQ
jgi:hypothetical protein